MSKKIRIYRERAHPFIVLSWRGAFPESARNALMRSVVRELVAFLFHTNPYAGPRAQTNAAVVKSMARIWRARFFQITSAASADSRSTRYGGNVVLAAYSGAAAVKARNYRYTAANATPTYGELRGARWAVNDVPKLKWRKLRKSAECAGCRTPHHPIAQLKFLPHT